ncbi:MAG: hypothetical protein TREMPRED_003819 [Tremellales sp. Tagirdzhanova-0007]|nr:MAG: hypothetical protein TREMPRED_003819 [Tremellales sp. Tagirdzhanova-0007]
MPDIAPIFGKFEEDERVHFDKTAGKWQYEDDETGQEYEWTGQAWIPLVDETLLKAQQAAYSVEGVDESTPANAVVARDERRAHKRKKGEKDYTSNTLNGKASSSTGDSTSTAKSAPAPAAAPKKTAVFVTNLPPDTNISTLSSVFSKAGVLLIGDDGEPRIKMYYDEEGRFKGEALIIYFKEGSVDLAITLLDDTELEMGGGFGNMRVKVAEYDKSQSANEGKKPEKKKEELKDTGDEKDKTERKKPSAEDKKRMTKRIKTMQSKLTWHSDSDSDDMAAPNDGAPLPGANRLNRVVVLKGMFSLDKLEKDPALLLELKEDVREEAESLGQVTSLILYDKEDDGVMTIKFKENVSAQACVTKMNGRFFDGSRIQASIYSGKERYRKSGGTQDFGDEDADKEEKERLDNFASWLVDGDE